MKIDTKRLIAASLATVMTASVCAMFAGCDNNESTDGSSTPLITLPPEQTTDTTSTTASTSGSETTETTTGNIDIPIKPTGYTNPLTGMPSVNDVSNTRPIAIVVDNHPNAYANQTGLDQADVLYEMLVAPGITRFLMVASDYTQLDSVCNIRSGRDYHLDIAAFHNAVLVCHGGSITENYDFYSLAANRLGSRWGYIDTMFEYWFAAESAGEDYGTIDNYGDRVDLKYDTIFKPEALSALLKSKSAKFVKEADGSLDGSAKESLKFVAYGTDKDMSGASDAANITLRFTSQGSSGAKNVSFKYDAATGKYLRNQDNMPHVDTETGKQLSFTNVITLFTDVETVETGISNDPTMTLVETRGSGIGFYFYGGKVINIEWESNGADLILTDPNGDELELATGNTYIGYLDNDYLYNNSSFWD